MKAHVDESACIGCGVCEATAPATFELQDNIAKVIEEPVSDEAAAEAAKDSCPVGAITLD